jgi:hypothetical protein
MGRPVPDRLGRKFIFGPYYQDTKPSPKTRQNTLRVLWWKSCGMLDKTLVPKAKSLTNFPHLGGFAKAEGGWEVAGFGLT